MKKIIQLIIILVVLTSCFTKIDGPDKPSILNNSRRHLIIKEKKQNQETKETTEEISKNEAWTISGNAEYKSSINKKIILIKEGQDEFSSVVLKTNNFMLKSSEYLVNFSIISDLEKSIIFEINNNEYSIIKKTLKIEKGENDFEFAFNNNSTSYDTVVNFLLGDAADIIHNIEINDFSILAKERTIGSRINQIGYLTNMEKPIVFNYEQGNYFNVYDAISNEVVYTQSIGECKYENDSNEYVYKSSFSDFKEQGTYYIKSELGGYSYVFTISDSVYDNLASDALKFIYLQRCGFDINRDDDDKLYHVACHTDLTKIYTTLGDYYIDTVGGWHDAGDYGRYMQTSNKVLADLLYTYLYTNNKSEELLDEIRWGLEWSLKMQRSDGSTYNKISTKTFADFVLPENDSSQLYALWPWTVTTASFAGVFGLAYDVYKNIDSEFAEKCLIAHKKAIGFLLQNDNADCKGDPEGFATGYYTPDDESDERLFAYLVAFMNENNSDYYNKIKELLENGLKNNAQYANFRLYSYVLIFKLFDSKNDIYIKAKEQLENECSCLVNYINDNAYSYALDVYSVGSNQQEAEAINELLFSYYLLKNGEYLKSAAKSFNYLLGMNTLNESFVYGYGYNYPKTIHHRIANVRKTVIKGALVGGVCELLTEGKMSDYFDSTSPRARRFIDVQESYSNVEPTIYYNSSFVLSLGLLSSINSNYSFE